ncbi:MAG: alpha/beta hydrolase [Alphaproteobacteria bacterium]|nr:MAG: alpha/beta hydrolase [Alphaproteobacteria bacterium]
MQISVNGTTLWFDVDGPVLVPDGPGMRERPTLLLLHGGPGFDHTGFKPVMEPLRDLCQIVYLDHRGQGRSGGSDPSHWTLNQWADDVRAFCDALGIVRPIVLGQSFGGMVAQAYATRHPDHPLAVIFSSTTARWDLALVLRRFEEVGGPAVRAVAEAFWTRMTDADRDAYMRVAMTCYNPRASADPFLRSRGRLKPEVLRHFSGPNGEMARMDFRADLARVRCPTLVLGGLADPVTPHECSREIAAALVNAPTELVLMDGCGHGVWRDDPEAGIAVLRRFVERVAQARDSVASRPEG